MNLKPAQALVLRRLPLEFLDNITLRFTDDLHNHPGEHTHEFVIARGSVFRVVGAP